MNDAFVFVRVGSHRARNKLYRALGQENCAGYFSWDRSCTGGFHRIPADKLDEAAAITGITHARKIDDLQPCISFR